MPDDVGEFLDSLTGPQKRLLAFVVSCVPVAAAWKFPGGLAGDSVGLGLEEVFVGTAPWTGAIALITWLALAKWNENELAVLGGGIAILIVLALFAPTVSAKFGVQFGLAAEQVSEAPGGLLGEHERMLQQLGMSVAHNPKAAAVIAVVAAVIFIVATYWVLYGFWLWLAGIGCGYVVGCMLHDALTKSEEEAPKRILAA